MASLIYRQTRQSKYQNKKTERRFLLEHKRKKVKQGLKNTYMRKKKDRLKKNQRPDPGVTAKEYLPETHTRGVCA